MAATRAPLTVLVLAAGKGTRFRSKRIKLLHEVAGSSMVGQVMNTARRLKPSRLITVVGHQGDEVRAALDSSKIDFVVQKQQRGTGHAVMQAARQIGRSPRSTLLILNGDLPTLEASTLRRLVSRHRRSSAALTLLSAELDDPAGYGRVVRDPRGRFVEIVEHADASREQRGIREINAGIYCADPAKLLTVLKRVRPDNAQGEYYITDAVAALLGRGETVLAVCHPDAAEILGVNNRQELADAAKTLYARKAAELQHSGVTLLDADRTWIDPRARVGRDSIIHPGVTIEGSSVIGADCVVRQGCRIARSKIGNGVEVKDYSIIVDSEIGGGAAIGPFAHLRPGSQLDPGSKVGNFVELKKTRLGRGSKASHLAYLGDTTIGPGSNIGAGTITCNYDGYMKNPTVLGKGVFIGSNSQLIAPLRVNDGAYVAAGSTVTKDVPKGALAIGRSRQTNVEGWVARKVNVRKTGKKPPGKR